MKLGLKINNALYINKSFISKVLFEKGFGSDKYFTICIYLTEVNDLVNVKVDKLYNTYENAIYVPINEFNRISREIKEYLGIDKVRSSDDESIDNPYESYVY